MSDTPRTDAKVAELHAKFSNSASDFLAMVVFASTLERELATARLCGICGEKFLASSSTRSDSGR